MSIPDSGMPKRGVLTVAEIQRQCLATAALSPRRLPSAWYEPHVAQCMKDWIDLFQPPHP